MSLRDGFDFGPLFVRVLQARGFRGGGRGKSHTRPGVECAQMQKKL